MHGIKIHHFYIYSALLKISYGVMPFRVAHNQIKLMEYLGLFYIHFEHA